MLFGIRNLICFATLISSIYNFILYYSISLVSVPCCLRYSFLAYQKPAASIDYTIDLVLILWDCSACLWLRLHLIWKVCLFPSTLWYLSVKVKSHFFKDRLNKKKKFCLFCLGWICYAFSVFRFRFLALQILLLEILRTL